MKKRSRIKVWLVLFIALLGGGSYSVYRYWPKEWINPDDVCYYRDLGVDFILEGRVAVPAETGRNSLKLILDKLVLDDVLKSGRKIYLNGKVLLLTNRFPEYGYGDRLRVAGRLEKPQGGEEGVFDYAGYLAKEGICAVVYFPKVVLKGHDDDFWSVFYWFRSFVGGSINDLFGAPAAALVEGVLVGEQKGLGDNVAADFSVAGLTHILAISGYNITLVINIMALLLKTGGRRLRFYITLLALFVFAAITGFSASVIRASLMGGFVTMALFAGRRADAVNVLLFSALMMVFFNPLIVFYDVSFQLSFLSTLGLILMSPLWKKVARYLPPLIGEDLAVTLSAQIFTTPIILYNFSQLSLVAPVTNIIFLPLIPLIMASGFLAVVLFLLMPLFPVYLIVSTLCWLLCRLLLDGVHLFASLPLASIKIINFDLWWLCFYYAFLLAGLVWIKVKSRPALEQGG